jgi:hypothetical protein
MRRRGAWTAACWIAFAAGCGDPEPETSVPAEQPIARRPVAPSPVRPAPRETAPPPEAPAPTYPRPAEIGPVEPRDPRAPDRPPPPPRSGWDPEPEEIPRDVQDLLDSGYVVDRVAAVEDLAPDGKGLDALRDLLAGDPAPEVRAAAAEQLGFGGTHGAVSALVSALGDADPRVVVSAVEALEMAGDETVVPKLIALLDHPDDQVRQVAAEAIELLE